jgi:hypothetical protein
MNWLEQWNELKVLIFEKYSGAHLTLSYTPVRPDFDTPVSIHFVDGRDEYSLAFAKTEEEAIRLALECVRSGDPVLCTTR